MALIHWWPLNGDTKDYGLNPVNLTNNGATINNNGKIGKCYEFNAGSRTRLSSTVPESLDYPLTICAWIYPTDVSSTITQYAFSYNTDIGGTAGHAIGFGFYQTVSNAFTIWYKGQVIKTSYMMSNNIWYHVGISIDSNNTINAYVNGTKVFSTTNSSTKPASTWFTLGARCASSTGGNGDAAYYFSGLINDARVYDHALTEKEFKEISKGLVLHYDFEDEEIEGTTNLFGSKSDDFSDWSSYGFGSKGQKTITTEVSPALSGQVCKVTRLDGSGTAEMATWITGPQLTNGQYVYFSAYVRGVGNTIGKSGTLHIYNSNGTDTLSTTCVSFNFTDKWQRVGGKWTWNKNTTSGRSYSCYVTGSSMAEGDSYYFCNVQLESMKDHMTPWTNGTRGSWINLISTVVAGGGTVKDSSYAIHTDGTDSDTYFYLEFNKSLEVGRKYYMTCNVSGFENDTDYWNFPICSQAYTDNKLTLKNGVCTALFEWRESRYTTNNNTRTILDDSGGYTSGVRSRNIYITNIAVYELPIVYDTSGYGNNGLAYNLPIITTSTTGLGAHSLYFDGRSTSIQTPNLANLVHDGYFTIIGWFMHTSSWSSDGYETLYGGPSGFEIEAKYSVTDSPAFSPHNWGGSGDANYRYVYSLNEWHQWAMVRTPSNALFYIDGVLRITGSRNPSIPSGDYFIGAWKTFGQQNFKGYMSDFKIYSTALSAADILKEYQSMATIDKKYNLSVRMFNEDSSRDTYGLLTQDGVFTVNNLDEYSLPKEYQRVEYIQSSGTQYIDTGIVPTVAKQTKITGTIQLTDKTKGYNQSLGCNSNLNLWASANTLYFRLCGLNTNISLDTNKHTFSLQLLNDGRHIRLDNYTSVTSLPSTLGGSSLALGALNDTTIASTYWGKYKIYNCKIYDNNVLVRDFIPCYRKSDNEVGMYDLVEGSFYANQGSGMFTAGPAKNNLFFKTYDNGRLVASQFYER